MATNKPQVKAYIEKELKDRFTEICKKEDRSESNMIEHIIKRYVEEYEAQQTKKQESSAPQERREKSSISRTG